MPPRLPLQRPQINLSSIDLLSTSKSNSTLSSTIPFFLVPFLHTQSRNASILASLSDRPGAYNKRIRRGRGPASGKGGKSGRGSDGQKQHGKVPAGFNGGQTPEHIVHGRYGFINLHATEMSPLNLDTIQSWIDQNRLDPKAPITVRELLKSRALHGVKDGVKLLARGSEMLKTPIHIVVSRASQSAIAAVEAIGGTVTTRFYTPQAIRRIKRRQMHPYLSLRWDPVGINNPALMVEGCESLEYRAAGSGYEYRLPDPTSRSDIEYYRDVKNRGYLSHTVKEGEGPSLYFKPPVSEEQLKELRKKNASGRRAAKEKEENKLW
ncbi:ribosomal protein L15 [Rhinocladiella mackenziei CBS 650.93]|uniref:Rhinocladiella mackenziei CBS 650.93 unplaced genomic scaffold supercont1.2, whole genome shotgun sequence n=1 Tax=Rhinocladiella mackenziei CBS 650.93 TaxID=1442369 RepID=A0A0D2G2J2_9EURO|nr:ribosomal protein L15 [Rhinocladiella mackenziei CBS 650.93]KIX08767.1 ribosomal protein L15 [Rhinocladiella mackenziei CBS 650.93]